MDVKEPTSSPVQCVAILVTWIAQCWHQLNFGTKCGTDLIVHFGNMLGTVCGIECGTECGTECGSKCGIIAAGARHRQTKDHIRRPCPQ